MLFTTTTEYAIRGLAELVSRSENEPVLLAELVTGTDLPREFMAKVFQRLVKAGILSSAKGRGGGFSLSRSASEITLMDILVALEGQQHFGGCVVGLARCNDTMPCPQHELYKPVRQKLRDYLQSTTVADLGVAMKAKKRQIASEKGDVESPSKNGTAVSERKIASR
jgi:Rrf2 family transcriptional regulator, iron-sulfur cluster assembly transcription factor